MFESPGREVGPSAELKSGEPKSGELKVFISHRDSACDECHEPLGRNAWVVLAEPQKALCLACGELDHLVFLPSGDAAVTRRAKKYSSLFAVVLRWSRARRRYERQGLLVEEEALAKAEAESLTDEAARQRRRERNAERLAALDKQYVHSFAERVRAMFPGCPAGRERVIAEHACRKYSDRVGRTAAAKRLDEAVVRLAVAAHVRHAETDYDRLFSRGHDRQTARRAVQAQVDRILATWAS
jgi:predicted CXXCH cytochrome family protein